MLILIGISLSYWLSYLDAMKELAEGRCGESGERWNSCVERIGNSQQNAMNFAIWAVVSGLLSAGVFFFGSKRLSGGTLIFVAGFIFYGYLSSSLLSDSAICELPDDKGLGEIPPAKCTAYNYAGPSLLVILGGWLVYRETKSKPLIPKSV